MNRSISADEVSKHDSLEDLWLVVDGAVYDLTDFAPEHPGGVESMSCLTSKPRTGQLLILTTKKSFSVTQAAMQQHLTRKSMPRPS
jgi:Cytochrome b5-like Heme/Steroid binding domain